MIRLCVEVLGFFLFLMLLVNVGNANDQIDIKSLTQELQQIIVKNRQFKIEVVRPKIVPMRIRQL